MSSTIGPIDLAPYVDMDPRLLMLAGALGSSALYLLNSPGYSLDVWNYKNKKATPRYQVMDLEVTKIHYCIVSPSENIPVTGPALLIATDPPVNIELYASSLLQKLANATGSRVVCFELPGFGFSYPKQGFNYSFNQSVKIITSFLHKLGLGPYVLLFSCVSGLVALKLAQTQPDLVKGLVLSQCSSYGEEKKWAWRMDIKGLLSTKFVGQILMTFWKDFMTRKWFFLASGSKPAARQYTEQTIKCNHKGAAFSLSSALQEFFYNVKKDPLQNTTLNQPALVIWGRNDRSHRPTDRKAILQYLTHDDVAFKEYEGIGHFPDLEQEDEFVKQVKEFLDSHINNKTLTSKL